MRLLVFIGMFSMMQLARAQYVRDTIVYYTCYPGSPYKIKEERYARTYNEKQQLVSRRTDQWERERKVWRLHARDTFLYNEQGHLLSETAYILDSQGRDKRQGPCFTYTYDSLGNCIGRLQTNTMGNETRNSSKTEYRFEGNKLIEFRHTLWDYGGWNSPDVKTYSYDSAGRMLSEIETIGDKRSLISLNYRKTVYQYDKNGRGKSSFTYHWDTLLNDWTPFLRMACRYNIAGKDSICIYERWKYVSGGWDSIIHESFAYDSRGYQTMKKRQIPNKSRSKWIESSKSTWAYDAAGCVLVSEWCDEWNPKIKAYAVRHRREWFSRQGCEEN